MSDDPQETAGDGTIQQVRVGASPALGTAKGRSIVRNYVERLLRRDIVQGLLDRDLVVMAEHIPETPCEN